MVDSWDRGQDLERRTTQSRPTANILSHINHSGRMVWGLVALLKMTVLTFDPWPLHPTQHPPTASLIISRSSLPPGQYLSNSPSSPLSLLLSSLSPYISCLRSFTDQPFGSPTPPSSTTGVSQTSSISQVQSSPRFMLHGKVVDTLGWYRTLALWFSFSPQ